MPRRVVLPASPEGWYESVAVADGGMVCCLLGKEPADSEAARTEPPRG
ncbi:hypothetical protein ACFWCB_04815 [Streptomyces sp. NPDC060048]